VPHSPHYISLICFTLSLHQCMIRKPVCTYGMPKRFNGVTFQRCYLPMVQKSSVRTCQTCQIKCYCTPNIYPIYSGSEIVGSHMSNMPNKMLLHSEHIPYLPMVQKSSVRTCQTCQIKCYCIPNILPYLPWFRNRRFAHVKHAK